MKIYRVPKITRQESPPALFKEGGSHHVDIVGPGVSDTLDVGLMELTAGARLKRFRMSQDWYCHVTGGRGLIATAGEETEIGPDTAVLVPAGEVISLRAQPGFTLSFLSIHAADTELSEVG